MPFCYPILLSNALLYLFYYPLMSYCYPLLPFYYSLLPFITLYCPTFNLYYSLIPFYWGGGIQPHFCPWKNGKKSIWKETEKYSFPSLSMYFFPIFPHGKKWENTHFSMGKNGVGPPLLLPFLPFNYNGYSTYVNYGLDILMIVACIMYRCTRNTTISTSTSNFGSSGMVDGPLLETH